jgi:hypothetical protein
VRIPKESRKKAKPSQAAESESDNDNSDGSDINKVDQMDVDTQDDATTSTNMRETTQMPQNLTMVSRPVAPLIPSPVSMTQDEYEFQVMDMYINAKAQKLCCQKVCDKYFSNDTGQDCITHFNSIILNKPIVKELEPCCMQCTVQTSHGGCCDSCIPDLFPFLSPPSPPPKPACSKHKFEFDDYTMHSYDFQLRHGLDNW